MVQSLIASYGMPMPAPRGGLRPLMASAVLGRTSQPVPAFTRRHLLRSLHRRSVSSIRAEEEASNPVAVESGSDSGSEPGSDSGDLDDSFVAVTTLEEVPKGSRREVVVAGKNILLFWYRNELRACEARSPAEGAYSEGFLSARFTEDYGIVCPTTGSVFSIKTGEILDWYPNNPVLSRLIPTDTCRPLEIYPVRNVGNQVYVSFLKGTQGGVVSMESKGGMGTSLENNNVFYLEPKMYVEGTKPGDQTGPKVKEGQKINPATLVVAIVAVAIIAVAGTGLAVYNESVVGLVVFWGVGFGAAAYSINKYTNVFSGEDRKGLK